MAQHQKKCTVAVFLDFSKPSDMVWKNGLMQKIDKVGIKGAVANYVRHGKSVMIFIHDVG